MIRIDHQNSEKNPKTQNLQMFSSKSPQTPKPTTVKIMFIGSGGSGKTCLIYRLANDSFMSVPESTIGIDFRIKYYQFGEFKVKAMFWDTVGAQRFKEIRKIQYRKTTAMCVCFSVANRYTFQDVNRHVSELFDIEYPRDCIFLIGCKSDLPAQVSKEEIMQYAKSKNLTYYQTSSLSGEGISEPFKNMVQICSEKEIEIMKLKLEQQPIKISEQNNKKTSRCY